MFTFSTAGGSMSDSRRLEEEPEPEPEPQEERATPPSAIPSVGEERELEYRTEVMSHEKVTNGKSLVELLNQASTDGWDLVDVLAAGQRHVVLLRRVRRERRGDRQIGFTLPGR
jgi:hypothetical protein